MSAADSTKRLAQIAKLVALADDLAEKLSAVHSELGTIAAGGDGQGIVLKRLYAHFSQGWTARYPGQIKYGWVMPDDGAKMKRLLKIASEAEIVGRMDTYLGDDADRLRVAQHPFGWFVGGFNGITSASRTSGADVRTRRAEQHRTWADRCRHEPHCGSETTCALVTSRSCPHGPRCGSQASCLQRITDGDWGGVAPVEMEDGR